MTPESFIAIWKDSKLTERAGAQAHFDDLCDLLGVDKPRDPDNYCFERGTKKSGGGDGWADVWKRDHFAWENKKPGRDLQEALKQLTDYALHLDNPPLLVVSDRERIIVHTAFTGYPDQPREIRIDDLIDPGICQMLRWVFTDPIKLRPEKSTAAITAEAASKFAGLAMAMRARGLGSQKVAHFLVQCLFCMFAEDEGLLPGTVFTCILKNAKGNPEKAAGRMTKLFAAMREQGGEYGDHDISWFNGGLFSTIDVPCLIVGEAESLEASATMDWRAIDPTIFGTLFERSLDPSTRAPLGAHYTDVETINKIIRPLVTEPLLAEWEQAKAIIAAGAGKGPRTKEVKNANTAWQNYQLRLQQFRVLDPACGSGNFLYLALIALRDVERKVMMEGKALANYPQPLWVLTGPHNILGIEINEYAAELARTTVWIGDIQWCRRNGRNISREPILRPLDAIEHRDALLNMDGQEASWPAADVIVGNPPFLGGSKKRGELGDDYFNALAKCYGDRVPPGADMVTYWFEKARSQIDSGKCKFAGLVATNSIRGGASRKVLERVVASTRIFETWSDEPWVNEGAAVRVSLVCFGNRERAKLNGTQVETVHADLTGATGLDLTKVRQLPENAGVCFMGASKKAPFDIPGESARQWLSLPNPNGRPNSEVLRPLWNGIDLARRNRDVWVIDFGTEMQEQEASLYEAPFEHVIAYVRPIRIRNNRESYRKYWWRHAEARPGMRNAISSLKHYIATAEVSKHRLFIKICSTIFPDQKLYAIARADDATFGILSSRFHELWALAVGSWHGKGNDPRYTPTTTFETFPFPPGLSPMDTKDGQPDTPAASAIAQAAKDLDKLRQNWLNPPEWVDWVITEEEKKAGFPARPVAKPGHEKNLKSRTLTNLYNNNPAWLTRVHHNLDVAVAEAYGWKGYDPENTSDEVILKFLLELNLTR